MLSIGAVVVWVGWLMTIEHSAQSLRSVRPTRTPYHHLPTFISARLASGQKQHSNKPTLQRIGKARNQKSC